MSVATLIAKAVLGGIGGGFNGAKDGHAAIASKVGTSDTNHSKEFYNTTYGAGNMGLDNAAKQKNDLLNKAMQQGSQQASNAKGGENAGNSGGADAAGASTSGADAGSAASGAGSAAGGAAAGAGAGAAAAAGASDIDLKSIYGDSIDDRIIENFAKISAIDFHYKPSAQKEYNGAFGVDNKEHIGIKAQELQDNEATKGTVSENENGDLIVDTRHLTFADTAAIAELSRRVLALEEIVKELQNK